MSLYRKYFEKYEKVYLENSELIREKNENCGFYFLKEYIWIALDYLEDVGVIESSSDEKGRTFDNFKPDKTKLTSVLFKLENEKEYMMIDTILRFVDDLKKWNKKTGKDMFYNVGINSGESMSSYYQAIMVLSQYSLAD